MIYRCLRFNVRCWSFDISNDTSMAQPPRADQHDRFNHTGARATWGGQWIDVARSLAPGQGSTMEQAYTLNVNRGGWRRFLHGDSEDNTIQKEHPPQWSLDTKKPKRFPYSVCRRMKKKPQSQWQCEKRKIVKWNDTKHCEKGDVRMSLFQNSNCYMQ